MAPKTQVRRITLDQDDARRDFTSTDSEGRAHLYRLMIIDVMSDGGVYCWAAQMTKGNYRQPARPYKSGMGLNMGRLEDVAKFYGQSVADVAAEAVKTAGADEPCPASGCGANGDDQDGELAVRMGEVYEKARQETLAGPTASLADYEGMRAVLDMLRAEGRLR